ncbi:MAG: OmpA family protein, partial [Actinomycetota bacterium]
DTKDDSDEGGSSGTTSAAKGETSDESAASGAAEEAAGSDGDDNGEDATTDASSASGAGGRRRERGGKGRPSVWAGKADPIVAPAPLVIDEDRNRVRNPLLALAAILGLTVAVAWLITQVTADDGAVATGDRGSTTAESVAGPVAEDGSDVDESDGPADDGGSDDEPSSDTATDNPADADADADDGSGSPEPEGLTEVDPDATDDAGDEPEEAPGVGDAELAGRVAAAVQGTGSGDDVAVTVVQGEVNLGGATTDAEARAAVEAAAAGVEGVKTVTSAIRLTDEPSTDAAGPADDAEAGTDTDTDPEAEGAGAETEVDTEGAPADEGKETAVAGPGTLNEELGLEAIRFEYYSEDLSAAGRAELDRVVEFLDVNDGIDLEIEGHTDDIGPAGLNQRLGQRRAEAVRDYLVANGVEADRLTAVGIGEGRPIASNDTEAGREANRRIEFVIG